jgi:beta-glucosidase/6-phospho-beta-glucosidase/beta-galactosidase
MIRLFLVLLATTATLTTTRTATADSNFFWGVANSAFQVEGSPAPSDWYEWTHTKGKIQDGTNADIDYDNGLKRTPKPSYEVYRDFILDHLF